MEYPSRMQRVLPPIGLSAILGVFVGSGLAFIEIGLHHYLSQGLHALALGIWLETAWEAALVAVSAGFAAQVLRLLGGRISSRNADPIGEKSSTLIGLAVLLCTTLPVWWWALLHASPSLRPGPLHAAAAVAALGLIQVVIYLGLRRVDRAGSPPRKTGLAAGAISVCVLAVLGIAHATGALVPSASGKQPNVLMIVMDTVRADRLSSYGYARATTPELDAFAQEAIRYSNFHSTSSWTVPSHASLFTGLYPLRHGAHQEKPFLDAEFPTLAEILGNAGYRTFAASQNPFVSSNINLDQGFRDFVDLWRVWVEPDGKVHHVDEAPHPVNAAFERFLADAGPEGPFFAFLNYIDAHLPLSPPEPFLSRFHTGDEDLEQALAVGMEDWHNYYVGKPTTPDDLRILSDLYDAEVAHISHAIGQLLDTLRRDGRFDDTLIIITSDHGEQLGENHHLGHVFSLYGPAVRVPLLIRPPGPRSPGRVDDRPGQLVDLLPTVLGETHVLVAESSHQGLDLLARDEDISREAVLSEYYYPAQVLELLQGSEAPELEPYRRRLRAIEIDRKKLIWSSKGDHEFYDLERDPGETENLYDPNDEAARAMLEKLDAMLARFSADGEVPEPSELIPEFDEETTDALRALGYVH
jgi:arylsulfatase A-like enzyme